MSAERAARAAAAAAVAADFARATDDFIDHGGPEPDHPALAWRLYSELRSVLQLDDDGQADALTPDQRDVLAQALADAIEYRTPGADCADCDEHPAGLCPDHADDLNRSDAYLAVASQLGIEVDR